MARPLSRAKALGQYVKVELEIEKLTSLLNDLVNRRDTLHTFIVEGVKPTLTKAKYNTRKLSTSEFVRNNGGRATVDEIAKFFGISRPKAQARIQDLKQRGKATYKDKVLTLKEAA